MDKNIKKILADLYSVDQSLQKHEAELITIIKNIIASRPEVKYNKSFKKELRSRLLEQVANLPQQPKKKLNINNFTMNKIFYGLGALVLMLIIILPTVLKNPSDDSAPSKIKISRVGDNAFGMLTMPVSNQMMAEEATGLGGGNGKAPSVISNTDSRMIYRPTIYKYTYVGDDFDVNGDQMLVYKKIKGLGAQSSLAQAIKQADLRNFDLSKIQNSKLQTFHIVEDRNYGYEIYVDLYEGIMSVSQNWRKWPHPEVIQPIDIDQMPEDTTLIAVANSWLQQYNIDVSQYGQPYVENQWKNYIGLSAENIRPTVPEVISVVYPQTIENYTVYEEYGGTYGIRVSINLREKKIVGAWGISTQNYQSSMYDMETDKSKIMQVAKQGGGYNQVYEDENAETIEIKLGTPFLSYINTWQQNAQNSSQLFVPAMVFPVVEKPADQYFYREHVVVPLLPNMIDQRLSSDIPNGQPMPLLER